MNYSSLRIIDDMILYHCGRRPSSHVMDIIQKYLDDPLKEKKNKLWSVVLSSDFTIENCRFCGYSLLMDDQKWDDYMERGMIWECVCSGSRCDGNRCFWVCENCSEDYAEKQYTTKCLTCDTKE